MINGIPLSEEDMKYYDLDNLALDIIKYYKKYDVYIGIPEKNRSLCGNSFKFKINLKKDTLVNDIKKYAETIQTLLKLPKFNVYKENGCIYIIVSKDSKESPVENNLLHIMKSPEYINAKQSMVIAHPIGVTNSGKPIISDLCRYPHAMVSGTTMSGKTVALKCLLISLLTYSPQHINLLIADKVGDLLPFDNLPHLSYPTIKDPETFYNIILILKDELERRNNLKNSNKSEFNLLPRIIFVIDEFSLLIDGLTDKRKTEQTINILNEILRWGRHVRIHIILAVDKATKLHMKINKSDLSVRLMFQVSDLSDAMATSIEGGAEKLKGEGDMLFRQKNTTYHLQGLYISSEEIEIIIDKVLSNFTNLSPEKNKEYKLFPRGEYGFTITDSDLKEKEEQNNILDNIYLANNNKNKQNIDNKKFIEVIIWTLKQEAISINLISKECHIGFNKSKDYFNILENNSIIGGLFSKDHNRTKVIPQSIEEIPKEIIELLSDNGVSLETISKAICERHNNNSNEVIINNQ